MAEKNNIKIGFEKQIWDAACVLWGHIPAAEYRKVMVMASMPVCPVREIPVLMYVYGLEPMKQIGEKLLSGYFIAEK